SSLAVQIAQAGQDGPRGPLWMYRNTIRGIVAINKRDYLLDLHVEKDVIVHDVQVFGGPNTSGNVVLLDGNDPADRFRDPATWAPIALTLSDIECHARSDDGVLDAQYRLQGSWRSQYLGRRGAEIHFPGDAVFGDGFEGV